MPTSTIVTTPGSALANAYCDVAFADQFHLDRPTVGSTWAANATDQKTAAILWATVLLDRLWVWTGYPTDAIQALLWPRGGMLKRNGWEYVLLTVVPPEIQQACAEYARQLLVTDRTADSDIQTLGITSVKAGSVELRFKDYVYAKVVPDAVYDLVPSTWGYPTSRATGVRDLLRA
jgi:hypothetical protein